MKLKHWFLIASLYVTQFLPVSFFFMGLPAILRQQGKTLEEIGALYLLGFVWVLKIFWAPLVDRVSFGRLGHYRGWLIVMQTAMVGMLVLISQIGDLTNFPLLVILGLILTIFSATQDIAADAITCRLLPAGSRGIGNSIQVGGGLIGIVFGGGVTLALYSMIGWAGCFMLMAAVLCVCLAQVVFFQEPSSLSQERLPRVPYPRIWRFWREPGMAGWALQVMIVPLGVGMIFAMLSPMLVDIGWSIEAVGFTLNIVGSLVGLAAVAVTGLLIKHFGRRRVLIAAAFIQAVVVFSVLPLASGETDTALILPGVVLVFLIYNPVATVMLTGMMDRASFGSEGTDFTVQYSLYSFMGFLSGILALQVAAAVGYQTIVLIAASLAVIAGILVIRLYQAEPRVASKDKAAGHGHPSTVRAHS